MFVDGAREIPGTLTRRRLLAGAAAAAGSMLVADGCSSTGVQVLTPVPEGAHYTLTVAYANSVIGGRRFRTRTYNGATVGPTMIAKPGTTLNVNVINALPPNPGEVVPASAICWPPGYGNARHIGTTVRAAAPLPAMQIDVMNNPHKFNTTNLHLHGIQTIPHIFSPIGTSDPSAPQLAIEPGTSFQYSLPIAPDQPAGLHWYHPHHHGSTDVQVSGGMAGLIIVPGPIDQVPEIAAARDIHLAIQTIRVNKSPTDPTLYVLEPTAYQPPPPYGNGFQLTPNYAMVTVNGQGVCWIDNTQNKTGPIPGAVRAVARPAVRASTRRSGAATHPQWFQ